MNRTVRTENGLVRGAAAGIPTITAFKGIPFAAPPVGANRWRVPQPVKDWEGVRECYTFAPAAMQQRPYADFENMYIKEFWNDPDFDQSEDCLYLNIWTPAKTYDEKLPVAIWYYGGGMQCGYTSEMEFDGQYIASRGVVFVSIAYRVGVFGYLAHPEITAQGKANGQGFANFGLHDQNAGLKWVKRNIAAFGGDPDSITIFGQSAGGRSVLFQSMTPYNKPGDITRVITQSGGGIPLQGYSYPTLAEAEKAGEAFFESIGVMTLDEARAIDAEKLRKLGVDYKGTRWGVCIDGDFVPDHPRNLLAKGKFLHVPMMCGYTKDDMGGSPKFENKDMLRAYLDRLFGADADKILSVAEKESADFEGAAKACAINGQRLGNELLAKKLVSLGLDAYFYCFDSDMPGDDAGAFHSSELWFVFQTLAYCWRPFEGRHFELARMVCNYWTNFMKTGDPNGLDKNGKPMPTWEKYSEEKPFAMRLHAVPEMETEKPSKAVEAMFECAKKDF